MKQIVLVSHGDLAQAVKESLEMIVGQQDFVHVVSLPLDGDHLQFEDNLSSKMKTFAGEVLIVADLLGGTPCNVAVKKYLEDPSVEIVVGLSLPLVLEAATNQQVTIDELLALVKASTVNVKTRFKETESGQPVDLSKITYEGEPNIVHIRIDERLIHGQVAGIWTTSLDIQRIIVINDSAAADSFQKSSLRMATPTAMRLSVLSVQEAVKYVFSGRYGEQRLFLLFKNPRDVLRFLDAGGKIQKVNVGNMSYKQGAREVIKNVQVLPEEEEIFQQIAEKGVTITAQLVPNHPVVDLMKKLATV